MNDDLEKCPFCGLRVETPCESPQPDLCEMANEVLLAQQLEAHTQQRTALGVDDYLEAERYVFEVAAYEKYLRMKEAGVLPDGGGGACTPDVLFWKQPNGEYGALAFNAAWWGWRAAKGLV